jgi:hypothetical protein
MRDVWMQIRKRVHFGKSALGAILAAGLCLAAGSAAQEGARPTNPLLLDRIGTPDPAPGPPKAPTTAKAAAPAKPAVKRSWNAAYTRGLYTVGKQANGVYYRKGTVLKVGINVIEADLSNPNVRVGAMVARGGIGTADRFSAMVRHAQPTAAITGTFFGIRNRIPTGDLVINGKPLFRGFIGTAVAISEDNTVSFIPTRYKDQEIDWSRYETVMRGGPRLVWGGRVQMTARSEGFRSLPISQRRTRTAVGLTRDNRLQFVAVRQGITLWELAKVMKAIGAYHSVALDGGTSTAMYFAGNYIANPGRGLTNVLMLYHRKEQYEAMRDRFGTPWEARTPATMEAAVPAPTPEPEIEGHGFHPAQRLDYPLAPLPVPNPLDGAGS